MKLQIGDSSNIFNNLGYFILIMAYIPIILSTLSLFYVQLQRQKNKGILVCKIFILSQFSINFIIIQQMSEPVKYLSVVSRVIQFYQTQIISMLKQLSSISPTSMPDLIVFKTKLEKQVTKLKEIQDQKSIVEDKISDVCQPLLQFLGLAGGRIKHTSQSERYALRSSLRTQDTQRMRLTGGLTKRYMPADSEPINESVQMDEIIKSYKIQQQIGPRMRMKWKSFKNDEQDQEKIAAQTSVSRRLERTTIGDNNIDLLSYTIPQIENSIKRLSLQSGNSRHRSPDKIFEAYRTVDTRGVNRKKFVPRLI